MHKFHYFIFTLSREKSINNCHKVLAVDVLKLKLSNKLQKGARVPGLVSRTRAPFCMFYRMTSRLASALSIRGMSFIGLPYKAACMALFIMPWPTAATVSPS